MNDISLFINRLSKKTIVKIVSKEVIIKTMIKGDFTLLQYCEFLQVVQSYNNVSV